MRSVVSRLVLAFFALGALQVARAEDKTVEISVKVISATTGNGGVDKRLEKFRDRLSDYKFSSYQLVSEQTVTLSMNKSQTIELPEKYVLQITPKSIEANGNIRVHLNVRSEKQPKLVDGEYAIAPGKDMIVGGMKQKDGALMVALTHRAVK